MRLYYRVLRFCSQLLFAVFFRGRVFGTHQVPRTGGVLLVANHQSFLDPVLATLALPRECHYMARDTLFKNGAFRWLIASLNAYPIKRGTADVGGIKETLRRLKSGALVTTFPEATRTHDGSIAPMQPGIVLLARKARVPVVPCVILGAYQAWPRSARLPHPHGVVVAYDQPLDLAQFTNTSDDAIIADIRNRIIALQKRYEHHPVLK